MADCLQPLLQQAACDGIGGYVFQGADGRSESTTGDERLERKMSEEEAKTCPHCGSEMKYVAVIEDPTTTKDIYKCEACRRYFSEAFDGP
jgi:hypothetical protein